MKLRLEDLSLQPEVIGTIGRGELALQPFVESALCFSGPDGRSTPRNGPIAIGPYPRGRSRGVHVPGARTK